MQHQNLHNLLLCDIHSDFALMISHHPFLLVVVYLWHLLVVLFIVINDRTVSKHMCLYLCMLLATEVIIKMVKFFYCSNLDLGHFLVLII
jgi:hypothetical protein